MPYHPWGTSGFSVEAGARGKRESLEGWGWEDVVDQVPFPRKHLGAGESPGRRWGKPPFSPSRSPPVCTGRGGRECAPGREAAAAPASHPRPLLPLRPGSPAPSLRQPRPHKS